MDFIQIKSNNHGSLNPSEIVVVSLFFGVKYINETENQNNKCHRLIFTGYNPRFDKSVVFLNKQCTDGLSRPGLSC